MAKRFTDTGKWKRPWFRSLSLQGKVLWQYICDECDHVGIFIADFELVTFQVGFKVDEQKLVEMFGDKLVKVEKDKFFVPSFFEFQYADAKDGFKAKQSAIKKLRNYGLIEESSDSLIDLTNSYVSVEGHLPKCTIIGIGKIKSKINTGDARGDEELATADDYEAVYKKYPKKVGKSDGILKLKKQCPTKARLAEFEKAQDAYVAKCRAEDIFFKNFDTFVNSKWRDCLEPDYGSVSGSVKSEPNLDNIKWDPA